MQPLENAEMQLKKKLESEGWNVVHKGWPDFACIRNGEMIFIEVKAYKGEMLKKQQHYILTNLAKLGLNCFKWTPDGEFERILPNTPLVRVSKKGRKLSIEEKLDRLSPEQRGEIRRMEENGGVVYI